MSAPARESCGPSAGAGGSPLPEGVSAPPLTALPIAPRGGRLVSTAGVAPTMLLTTTGRHSGRPRTTPVMYVRDGERFVISSENFGQRRPAAWPLNLAANPHATVQVGA